MSSMSFSLTVKKNQRYILKGPNGIGKIHPPQASHEWWRCRCCHHTRSLYRILQPGLWRARYEYDSLGFSSLSHDRMHGSGCLQNGSTISPRWWPLKESYMPSQSQKVSSAMRDLSSRNHLLILDEPSNHISFRHLPVIAEALNDYEGEYHHGQPRWCICRENR